MSARRRRRRRSGDASSDNQQSTAKGGGQQQAAAKKTGQRSGGSKNRSKNNRRSRGRGGSRRRDSVGLWGDATKLPEPRSDVRITDDPAAVPRSLGAPPLPGHDEVAVHYFAAVYDRAVMMAGALAAAGGLLEPEQLEEELGD
jgi:hypothetical protein